MLRFYFHPTPNSMKIALFLKEADLDYELVPVDTLKGSSISPPSERSIQTASCRR